MSQKRFSTRWWGPDGGRTRLQDTPAVATSCVSAAKGSRRNNLNCTISSGFAPWPQIQGDCPSYFCGSPNSRRLIPFGPAWHGIARESVSADRKEGAAGWLRAKGFGFITADDGTDAFVHYGDIAGDGFKTLAEGDQVEFEMTRGPKGMKAVNVRKV